MSQLCQMVQLISLPPAAVSSPHWPEGKLTSLDTRHHDRAASHVTSESLPWWGEEFSEEAAMMDREAWRAEVHGVTKSQTQLSD